MEIREPGQRKDRKRMGVQEHERDGGEKWNELVRDAKIYINL